MFVRHRTFGGRGVKRERFERTKREEDHRLDDEHSGVYVVDGFYGVYGRRGIRTRAVFGGWWE